LLGVVIGLYLARLGFSAARIGIVVSAGLAGGACAALLATVRGDRIGRRRLLVGLALLGAAGGVALAVTTSMAVVSAVAFLGMLNGMGRDRGASLVLEQAILPSTTAPAERTRAFAWYNVLQDAGHALGALLAGVPAVLERGVGIAEPTALRLAVLGYAALVLLTAVPCARLSGAVESAASHSAARVSRETRGVLWKISSLFALDALGGGFLASALVSIFFLERFGVGAGTLGLLFFGARVANALSHLGAAWLARRFGLLNTMVFTHVPSSLLLVTVAFAPSFGIAAALFLLREGLVEMDVPTRQSYVMAVVRPEERTLAAGVTHLVRTGGWAVAPSVAGVLMQGVSYTTPLVVGAALKVLYDALLFVAFRGLAPRDD
jgi:MFS family permease